VKDWKTPLFRAYYQLLNGLPVEVIQASGIPDDFAVEVYQDMIPPAFSQQHGDKVVYIVISDTTGQDIRAKKAFMTDASITVEIVAFDSQKQVSRRKYVNAVASLVLSQICSDFNPDLGEDFQCVTTAVDSDEDGFSPDIERWITWRNIRYRHTLNELTMGASFNPDFDPSFET